MNKQDLENLAQTARVVRRILLKKLGVSSTHSGLCGNAALPLCAELKTRGYDAIIVNGHVKVDNKPGYKTHHWVEVNSLVIDITGDQFNNLLQGQSLPEVLIAPYTLLPRYVARRKDKLTDDFLIEWLK